MEIRVMQAYKNKYTRELSRLLLIHLPPYKGRCYGLTGNFLPVIVVVRSNRKFNKMRGWYWTNYAVTNPYAKLSERMKLLSIDNELIARLWYRLKTVNDESIPLREVDIDINNKYLYVTVINPAIESIFLFYLNDRKRKLLSTLEKNVYAKPFYFKRFGKRIVNYVSDDLRIVSLFMGMRG